MLNTEMPKAKRTFSPVYELRLNVGFRRVTARHPCPICGHKKWCQVTRDGRLAHCMWESRGAVKRAKDDGYIHILVYDAPSESRRDYYSNTLKNHHGIGSDLAPLEIRHFAYSKLLELSPAWRYERELVTGERGLFARGFGDGDVVRFGALPPRVAERNALAQVINELLSDENPAYAAQQTGAAVLGVPGFWEGDGGRPRVGRASDYKRPALIIPYRDRQGMIQACQLRFGGASGKSLYMWLSTSEDSLDKEPRGTSSGSPIHFAHRDGKHLPDLPIIITEGALKAEAFVALRPACRAIATAGVSVAHQSLIEATRGEKIAIAFDSDHRQNVQVCRQLGKLIAEREQDACKKADTSIVVWEDAKGIDDAILQNVRLQVIEIKEWAATLTGEPLEAVNEVWSEFSFTLCRGEQS